MGLGEKLLNLRKSKGLSQEEVAEKIFVTRQTISKWETDQSVPDLDKIAPLCKLYGISVDELLSLEKSETNASVVDSVSDSEIRRKKALGLGVGIFMYFVAVAWIMVSIPVMKMNPIVSSAIFMLLAGLATFAIVYTNITYKRKKEKENRKIENPVVKQINSILSIIAVAIYMIISFMTMAWHVTWVIFLIYAALAEIVKLIFMLGGSQDAQ